MDIDKIIRELTVTNTGLLNIPNQAEREKLLYLHTFLIAPIEKHFKITKNSGFRCEAVNTKIGGSKTSQHRFGEALDFTPESVPEVFEWCRKNLMFGQLIDEEDNGKKWIHISLPRIGKPNMQVMRYRNKTYTYV
jgi:zinc D-Ala-D-Ala carboxypeptidase